MLKTDAGLLGQSVLTDSVWNGKLAYRKDTVTNRELSEKVTPWNSRTLPTRDTVSWMVLQVYSVSNLALFLGYLALPIGPPNNQVVADTQSLVPAAPSRWLCPRVPQVAARQCDAGFDHGIGHLV